MNATANTQKQTAMDNTYTQLHKCSVTTTAQLKRQ